MMGPSHRLLGAVTGAAYATFVGDDLAHVVVSAAVATVTSAGWLSPDVDQSRPAFWLRRMGARRLLRHRTGLTHWWALPVLAWLALPLVDPSARWIVAALVLGWASHLLGDGVFGRVPVVPVVGPMVGLRLRTGGVVETVGARLCLGFALGWLLLAS